MTLEERTLYEAERWFRSFLRGDRFLEERDVPLFSIMAERQNARDEVYLPRDPGFQPRLERLSEDLPTTLPPPSSGAQQEWIRITRDGKALKR